MADDVHSNDMHPRIVIIQTAFLGDVILSTPVIFRLRERFPDARIDYVTAPRGINVLETNPYLNRIVPYDKYGTHRGIRGFLRVAGLLKEIRYDTAIVIHRSIRSVLLAYYAGIPRRVGFANAAGSVFLSRKAAYHASAHEIERNLSLLGEIGINAGVMLPQVFPTREDEEIVQGFWARQGIGPGDGLIGIAPGSAWPTKRWPESHYAALIRKIVMQSGRKVILYGSEEDATLCERLREACGYGVFNAAGYFTPRQSVAALKEMKCLIANDNGAVHLGLSAGIRIAAIFGPTVPSMGFAPYGDQHRIIGLNLECRPCGKHGAGSCPLGHFKCMKDLQMDAVYAAVLHLIQ